MSERLQKTIIIDSKDASRQVRDLLGEYNIDTADIRFVETTEELEDIVSQQKPYDDVSPVKVVFLRLELESPDFEHVLSRIPVLREIFPPDQTRMFALTYNTGIESIDIVLKKYGIESLGAFNSLEDITKLISEG